MDEGIEESYSSSEWSEEASEEDLDEQIIRDTRDKIDAAADGDPSLPMLLRELGIRLHRRFMNSFDATDLEDSIELLEKCISLMPAEDRVGRSSSLFDLSNALHERFEDSGDMSDLERSIAAMRACVDGVASTALDQELRHITLSSRLRTRFKKTGAVTDIDGAILLMQKVVDGNLEPTARSRNLNTVGFLCIAAYEKTGQSAYLDRSILAFQEAVDLTPQDQPSRGRRVRDLGLWMEVRHSRTGNIADLDRAILLLQESVNLTPATDGNRAEWLHSFAVFLGHRYQLTGALADIEEGIRALEEGINLTHEINNRNQELAPLRYHLGMQLTWRYERTKAATDIANAIQALRQAIESECASPADNVRRIQSMGSLGNALLSRFRTTREIADLEEAISASSASVQEMKKDDLGDGHHSNNLASGLHSIGYMYEQKFLRSGNLVDLDETISIRRQCLSTAISGHPYAALYGLELGLSLDRRYQKTKSMPDLDEAISLCLSALHQEHSFPRVRIRAGKHLVRLCALASKWEEAYGAARAAIDLIPAGILQSLENSDKQQLIGQIIGLASDAAAVALMAGKDAHTALVLLEKGRGVLASSLEGLRADTLGLHDKHPELEERLIRLRQDLDQPDSAEVGAESPSWEARARRRYDASRELELLLVEIRQQAGFEDFLLSPTEDKLRSAASFGPVVLINVSKFRCDALLVDKHQIWCLPLPNLNVDEIERRARLGNLGSLPVLRWLWDDIAQPVLKALGLVTPPSPSTTWPHIWWIPTGPLRRFPLHAAGYHTGSLPASSVLDRAMSSYSFSIRSLLHSRDQRALSVTTTTSPVSPETTGKILLVAMPTTTGQTPLPFATQEIAVIQALSPELNLSPIIPARLKDDVVRHLPECKIFHFAGHGLADPINPAKSSLLLDDWTTNRLTVGTLMGLNLHTSQQQQGPFLAYLSACGTGRTRDEKLVDESVHVVGACHLAGFRHVIGTLWEVRDESCVDVARLVYQGLRDGGMSDESVCVGLHYALRELRRRWVDGWKGPDVTSEAPEDGEERVAKLKLKGGGGGSAGRADSELLYWVPYVHFG
ncbi:CHAT domain-containing protein [Rhypophila decipiens]|uniref:CHAT domain-containing protein n=1 Tax=Rhypophila decipiens TaxID=261697 RepID=A0AAN7B7I6_9PEZI|nr:CHAT domain-containing protein [Rhypophila decipiens]